VVIAPAEAETVYAAARAAEDRDPPIRVWLRHGGSLDELTGLKAEEITARLRERGWD